MKTETQQQIDKLQADLDRLKEIVSNEEPKGGEWTMLIDSDGQIQALRLWGKKFGFNFIGDFSATFIETIHTGQTHRKATDQEVLTAFTNYFRSKGFVSGKSKFKSTFSGSIGTYYEPLFFDSKNFIASNDGLILFNKQTLTLATLIEDEKIMVGENEVRIDHDGTCKIGRVCFTKHTIELLLPLNPIFQKILDRLTNN